MKSTNGVAGSHQWRAVECVFPAPVRECGQPLVVHIPLQLGDSEERQEQRQQGRRLGDAQQGLPLGGREAAAL
jgi:hypothetical protein